MYTQVELVSIRNDEPLVYWLYNNLNTQPKLKAGHGIRIREETPYFRVNRVFTTLRNLSDLPTKSRVGTIVDIN
jgi:hypothetical protein